MLADRVAGEIARLDGILKRRGGFFDDEAVQMTAYVQVQKWIEEDRKETERIEIEAAESARAAEESARLNHPNYQTRKLFEGTKINVPRKDR